MAIAFTPEEQAIIDQQRLPDAELPIYFNSEGVNDQGGGKQPISRDFEAYLILQPSSLKQSIQSWITAVMKFNTNNIDRDFLLTAYMQVRATDAALRLSQLDATLSNFSAFKASLTPTSGTPDDGNFEPSKFGEVTEIDLLSRALQRPIDETVMLREAAFHEQNMVKQLFAQLIGSKADINTSTELTDWQSVISTYAGQTA